MLLITVFSVDWLIVSALVLKVKPLQTQWMQKKVNPSISYLSQKLVRGIKNLQETLRYIQLSTIKC